MELKERLPVTIRLPPGIHGTLVGMGNGAGLGTKAVHKRNCASPLSHVRGFMTANSPTKAAPIALHPESVTSATSKSAQMITSGVERPVGSDTRGEGMNAAAIPWKDNSAALDMAAPTQWFLVKSAAMLNSGFLAWSRSLARFGVLINAVSRIKSFQIKKY